MIRVLVIFTVVLLQAVLTASPAVAAETPLLPLQRLALQGKNIAPTFGETTNQPAWHSTVSLGFSMTRGNSDTLLFTASLYTERKSALNEWLLGTRGAYGEDHAVKSYETVTGYGQFNHFFDTRIYGFGRADGLHDGIKDIQYRAIASTGLGYYLMQRTNTTFAVETGPSFVTEQQGNVSQNYAAWRLAERFEYKINDRARIWHSAELIPQVDESDNFIINAELGIETAIARDLSLRVYVLDNYVNLPAPSYKHNDVRLVSGIAYKF